MRASTPLKTSCLLLFATSSTSAHPQSFSLAIGFGSDDSPLTFFPDLATPPPAPSRSAPAPPQQPHITQPLPATQPSVPRRPPQGPSQRTQQRQSQSSFQSRPVQQQPSLPRNPPVFDTINSPQRQGGEQQESSLSHSEALARNAAARQRLEEVIAQHNQRSGFDQQQQQAPRRQQPNHFEQQARPIQQKQFRQPEAVVPSAPRRPQQQNLSPRKVPQQIESSDASVRKLSHDEALQRNALHRQQLAEVVAKHADKVDEVTKTLKIPEEEDNIVVNSGEPRRPQVTSEEVPRGLSVDRFLAKKTSSNKSQPTKESKT